MAPTSMAMKVCPSSQASSDTLDQERMSVVTPAPASTPARDSTSKARPYPLCAPKGVRAPVTVNTPGSVVGSPSPSVSHPSGSGSPRAWYEATLPPATVLMAMSRTMGGWDRAGTA